MKYGKRLSRNDKVKYWITSDLHLSHKKVLEYNDRPFDSVEHMNEGIIEEWNSKVSQEDVVFVLGDMFLGNTTEIQEMLDVLKGTIILVLGNHDRPKKIKLPNMHMYFEVYMDDVKICMSHYPMYCWNNQAKGSVMLHGHCHGRFQGEGRIMDVGYDKLGSITLLSEVVDICLGRPIVCPDGRLNQN